MVYRGIDPGWCIPQTILGEGVSVLYSLPYTVSQSRNEADNTSVNMFMDFLGYGRSKYPLFRLFPTFSSHLQASQADSQAITSTYSLKRSLGEERDSAWVFPRERGAKLELIWLFRIPHKRSLMLHSYRPLSTWIEPWMGPRSKFWKLWKWMMARI